MAVAGSGGGHDASAGTKFAVAVRSQWRWGALSCTERFAFIGGAIAGGWLASSGRFTTEVVVICATLVGAILASIVAGMAILTAALDRDFLRIHFFIHDEGPAKYFYPFLAVVAAGVAAAFLLLAMSIHPGFGLGWLRTAVGVLAGGFTLLSLSAIIIALGTLVDFVNAKQEAANFIDVQTLDELIKKDGVEDARSAFKEWLNSRDNSSGAGGS